MTSETSGDGSGESEIGKMQAQARGAIARLAGAGELVIALSAVLFLFVYVFGELVAQDYSLSTLTWLAAILVVGAVAAHRFWSWQPPLAYGTLLAALALIAGIVEAGDLIYDIRFDYLHGGARVFYALVAYAAGALALVGAVQARQDLSRRQS